MNALRTVVAIAVVSAGTARAQPGVARPPELAPSTAAIEQSVVEELAADGVILSRLGVVLELEAVDDVMLVLLVDPTSGDTVASTRLDGVPTDRDAAVAAISAKVEALVARLASRGRGLAADGGDADREREQREQRARDERRQRDQAQAEYDARAIRFGRTIVVWANGHSAGVGTISTATRGDTDVPMSVFEFYGAVGRPDLIAAYQRRRRIGYGGVGLGIAVMAGGLIVGRTIDVAPDYSRCAPGDNSCRVDAELTASSERISRSSHWMLGGLVLGSVPLMVGAYYLMHRQPISEAEARRLAGEHNRQLRIRLGLPVADLAPVSGPTLQLAPYASGGGGGLVLSGTF